MKYDCFSNDTYNLYTIETKKFRSGHMEVVFRCKATIENVTYIALLIDVLLENSSVYKTRKEMNRKLADLYNASLNATSSRVGGIIITNISIDFLNPRYTDMATFEETIALLFETIFMVNADGFEFDEVTFERVKRELRIEIESLRESPKEASIMGALKALAPHDPRSFWASGDEAILDEITPKKLYDFYKRFIDEFPRDIYLIADADMKEMNKIVRKYAKFKSIVQDDGNVYLPALAYKGCKTVSKKSALSQANLVQVYELKDLSARERDYVAPLFNMLWGSGSLESRLYKVLRAENSLCYNVSTFYQKYDHLIILHTAIDGSDVNKAKKLIASETKKLCKSGLGEEELESVKKILITSITLSLDNPVRLVDLYVFKNLIGLEDIEARIDKIKTVSSKEILNCLKKMQCVLSYEEKGDE